jgi:hypothetical protein
MPRMLPILLVFLMATSCWRGDCEQAKSALLKDLSSRLVFVGSYTAKSLLPPDHGEQQVPLPDHLESGRIYIFHSPSPVDDLEFASRVLPDTLRRSGFEITSAPKTLQGLVAVDPGGLVWHVKFHCEALSGEIYNGPDRALYSGPVPKGSRDDYILVFR